MLEFAEPVLFLFSVGAVCCFSTESHSGVSLLSQAQIRTRGNMACYHGFSYRKIDKIGLSNGIQIYSISFTTLKSSVLLRIILVFIKGLFIFSVSYYILLNFHILVPCPFFFKIIILTMWLGYIT